MRKLNHIGIVTTTPKGGEVYNEGMKVWLTDYNESGNKIEWLRFAPDSWMDALIQSSTHIAYEVEDLDAEMAGKRVLLPKTDCGGGMFIAFVEEEGIPIELIVLNK